MRLAFLSLRGTIARPVYALSASVLLLSQPALVAAVYRWSNQPLDADASFWILPLRRLANLPDLLPWLAAAGFAFGLGVAWAVAILSFRRASALGYGHVLAALSIVPAVQIVVVAILALSPQAQRTEEPASELAGANAGHILQGVLAGVAIIVLAVLVSAVTFGAYGWGLFVGTPFLVGVTTAYLANREVVLDQGKTSRLVLLAAALGSLALIMLALEGFVCILLASPLGALVAAIGGYFGRGLATIGHRRGRPLLSLALLPALFALEAATPPEIPIQTNQSVVIDASTAAVWRTLLSDEEIGPQPAIIAGAGFAYAIRGRLLGEGIGVERLGQFSTGIAHERVTAWIPERRLAFAVQNQPPMMEEMSPYRRVHAPHVTGYFETAHTEFSLDPLPDGRTRLTARASHVLRLDPSLYWAPMARWAIRQNVERVLASIKRRAERHLKPQAPTDMPRI